jgi:hypothetical protein
MLPVRNKEDRMTEKILLPENIGLISSKIIFWNAVPTITEDVQVVGRLGNGT